MRKLWLAYVLALLLFTVAFSAPTFAGLECEVYGSWPCALTYGPEGQVDCGGNLDMGCRCVLMRCWHNPF